MRVNDVLSRDTCMDLLANHSFGRIVVTMPTGMPLIRPVNYIFDEPTQSIVFRAAAGSKLFALLRSKHAAFEVDEIDETLRTGWSVIVAGAPEEVTDPSELARVCALDSWAALGDAQWLRIRAGTVSGRRLGAPAAVATH